MKREARRMAAVFLMALACGLSLGCARTCSAQAVRGQLVEPVVWVAPHCRQVNGRPICVAGHWHSPTRPCALCNPHAAPTAATPPPVASATQSDPAAPSPPPAPPPAPLPDPRLDRLANDLAGLRRESGEALAKLDGRVKKLDHDLAGERDALAGLARVVAEWRASIDDRIAALAKHTAAPARGIGPSGPVSPIAAPKDDPILSPELAVTIAAALGYSTPIGAGASIGLWLIARALRARQQKHTAGGQGAPAAAPFPDAAGPTENAD